MDKNSNILILGASGMVGKSLHSRLLNEGYTHIATPSSKQINLLSQTLVNQYFLNEQFDYVFFLAAKVGGIVANINSPATFGYNNLAMEMNVIDAAHKSKVKKMIFMASSCCYPRNCQQPMKEEYLLTGSLEPTNEMYALSKIMGLKLCESYNKQYDTNFITCMPCNIYGPNDNFDLQTSHVMSALIQKFHKAKINNEPTVTCFGTGKAQREFIYVDDVVDATLFLMNNYNELEHINIGVGTDVFILELANLIKDVVEYKGEIIWDTSKPDGMPRKVLDVSKINNLGWKSQIYLIDGIKKTYQWYLDNTHE